MMRQAAGPSAAQDLRGVKHDQRRYAAAILMPGSPSTLTPVGAEVCLD